ncbi:hypothetical protein L581_2840 [Serratia fonticola AU-AP2C]|nr:hypothetical protein L581_2840 [Serratia fonticola AU-AP2C]
MVIQQGQRMTTPFGEGEVAFKVHLPESVRGVMFKASDGGRR